MKMLFFGLTYRMLFKKKLYRVVAFQPVAGRIHEQKRANEMSRLRSRFVLRKLALKKLRELKYMTLGEQMKAKRRWRKLAA